MISDIGAERALIAGLCQYGYEAYVDISEFIDVKVFTSTHNQILFHCLKNLFDHGTTKVDLPSLISAANTLNYGEILTKEKKDLEYLRSLFQFPSHLENVKNHAAKVLNLHAVRVAQSKLKHAYDQLSEFTGNKGINEIIKIAEQPIFDLMQELGSFADDEPTLIFADIEEYITDKMDNPVDCIGIPTPFPIYNTYIGGGLRPGISLMVARPKQGKSTIAKEVSIYISGKHKIPVLYIDTEMDDHEQKDRSIAGIAQVDIARVETGRVTDKEREKILKEIRRLKGLKFYHRRVGGKDFDSILGIIRRWIHKTVGFGPDGKANPHVVIYDYFKLMDTGDMGKMQEYQALGYQFQKFSDFCKKYQTPVLAFGQTNRDGIDNDTSAVIAQSDRLLWFCISAWLYKRKTADEIAEDGPENGNMKLIQIESRFGDRLDDYINMQANLKYSSITELSTQKMAVRKAQQRDTGFEQDRSESTE